MEYIRYAIDGATRRNGKPDCVAAGAVLCQIVEGDKVIYNRAFTVAENGSTNQRGEMLALLEATTHFVGTEFEECQIITDSEYLFNTIRNDWLSKWNGSWVTSKGEPVKNSDIWRLIYQMLQMSGRSVNIYHIKGHVIPMGKATIRHLLEENEDAADALYKACVDKYEHYKVSDEKLENIQDLSVKNNGFRLGDDLLKTFVTVNTAADALAGYRADLVDAAHKQP